MARCASRVSRDSSTFFFLVIFPPEDRTCAIVRSANKTQRRVPSRARNRKQIREMCRVSLRAKKKKRLSEKYNFVRDKNKERKERKRERDRG